MATFRYAAKDPSGKTIEGSLQAEDRNEVVAELRRQNLVVLKVAQGRGKAGKADKKVKAKPDKETAPSEKGSKPKGRFSGEIKLFKPKPSASRQDLVLFTRQLATMIGAGLSLLESLEVLGDQADRPGMSLTCEILATELRGGSDLSSAMETVPKVFNPLYISMVCAGEVSGQMDVILERLADYQEDADALQREIKSAMTYPVISLVLVLGITSFLMLGVVPTFRQVFESLDTDLPGITQFTLGVSDLMRAQWPAIFGGLFGSVGLLWMFKKSQTGSLVFDHMALRAPIFGQLARKISLARFSRTFATLIRSGVPIMGTLDIVADTAGNQVVSNVVHKAKENVRNGNMLSEPLSESSVFPPMVVRMIAIGEKSGALEALLDKIAEFYDAQVKAQIKGMTSLIEPLLISFMGVLVGFVVLSVFMPILDIVGKLGN